MTDTLATLPDPEALHRALLAHHSATAVLESLYGGPVRIRRLSAGPAGAVPEVRALLRVQAEETILHRQVNLLRKALILSEADLWYVPGRLAPDMAAVLLETEIPFGRVVAPLRPKRITLDARLHDEGTLAVEHRALLTLPDQRPLAFVHERYPRRMEEVSLIRPG